MRIICLRPLWTMPCRSVSERSSRPGRTIWAALVLEPGVRTAHTWNPDLSQESFSAVRGTAVEMRGQVMAKVSGGDAIRKKLEEMARSARTASVLKVGFAEGATYPDGTSVPMVAAINEFGRPSRGQPPRPFFRRMVAKHKDEWPGAIAKLLKANDYDAKATLEQAGDAIAGQLRQSIVDLIDPPLAPSTIARKGFSKPLIDTSVLLNSVTHQVE